MNLNERYRVMRQWARVLGSQWNPLVTKKKITFFSYFIQRFIKGPSSLTFIWVNQLSITFMLEICRVSLNKQKISSMTKSIYRRHRHHPRINGPGSGQSPTHIHPITIFKIIVYLPNAKAHR